MFRCKKKVLFPSTDSDYCHCLPVALFPHTTRGEATADGAGEWKPAAALFRCHIHAPSLTILNPFILISLISIAILLKLYHFISSSPLICISLSLLLSSTVSACFWRELSVGLLPLCDMTAWMAASLRNFFSGKVSPAARTKQKMRREKRHQWLEAQSLPTLSMNQSLINCYHLYFLTCHFWIRNKETVKIIRIRVLKLVAEWTLFPDRKDNLRAYFVLPHLYIHQQLVRAWTRMFRRVAWLTTAACVRPFLPPDLTIFLT